MPFPSEKEKNQSDKFRHICSFVVLDGVYELKNIYV